MRWDVKNRDDNEAGFFGYPSRLAPNGTRFNFNKSIWNEFEIFLKKLEVGSNIALIIYKINFKINLI